MEPTFYRRRLPHIHIPGACFFVTFRLAPIHVEVLSPAERDTVVGHILRMAPGILQAWVVMPDHHVHLLYQTAVEESLGTTLQSLKGASSHSLARRYGRAGPIWQQESYDHVVCTERELLDTWNYVEANPVRRGLAPAPGAYAWSSASGRG